MNQYQPPKPDHTIGNVFAGVVLAAIAIVAALWIIDAIQTQMFVNDCHSQGGVAMVWKITGQKFCDLP